MPNNKIIKVKYKSTQGAEDLFVGVKNRNVYARQPSNVDDMVFWFTTNKWAEGYEANSPIRDGVTMQVVDDSDCVLFEETLIAYNSSDSTSAVKKGEFRKESVKRICSEYAEKNNLEEYGDWKKWLTNDIEKYQYKDYVDNWLYWERTTLGKIVVADTEILGVSYKIIRFKCRHRISGKTWEETELWNKKEDICEGICGYRFL